MLLYVHSSIAIILMGKRELVALLNLSSWFLVMVEWLFLAVTWGCLRFVIVVFPDHTHLLFLHVVYQKYKKENLLFFVITKYISSRELKTSEFLLLLRACENSDVFNTLDHIYLVFTSKK